MAASERNYRGDLIMTRKKVQATNQLHINVVELEKDLYGCKC